MKNQSSITFHSEEISFELDSPDIAKKWILQTIEKEDKLLGEINYIFCSDKYLLTINKEYLKHNTYTDIITFNYCEGNYVSADIFISIDRIKENSRAYQTTFNNELSRVMIHGILHLVGYDDKKEADKKVMRSKEDFYLSLIP